MPRRAPLSARAPATRAPATRASATRAPATCAFAVRAFARALVALALLPLASACEERRELREWRPQDHRHPPTIPLAADGRAAPTVTETLTPEAREARTGATYWNVLCAGCHGPDGLGDGRERPPMAQVANLSSPAWQASRTDEEIAQVIAVGRGMMPGFASRLDAREIATLVSHVRRLGGALPSPAAAPEGGGPAGAGAAEAPAPSEAAPAPPS